MVIRVSHEWCRVSTGEWGAALGAVGNGRSPPLHSRQVAGVQRIAMQASLPHHMMMVPGSMIDSLMSLWGSTIAPFSCTSSCGEEATRAGGVAGWDQTGRRKSVQRAGGTCEMKSVHWLHAHGVSRSGLHRPP